MLPEYLKDQHGDTWNNTAYSEFWIQSEIHVQNILFHNHDKQGKYNLLEIINPSGVEVLGFEHKIERRGWDSNPSTPLGETGLEPAAFRLRGNKYTVGLVRSATSALFCLIVLIEYISVVKAIRNRKGNSGLLFDSVFVVPFPRPLNLVVLCVHILHRLQGELSLHRF